MHDNVYQEYINSILGINFERNNGEFMRPENGNYESNIYENIYYEDRTNNEMEKFYPETYRLLYPMVQSACMRNTKPITRQIIDEMVKEIYTNFISNETTITNINVANETRASKNEKEIKKTVSPTISYSNRVSEEKREGANQESRQFRPNNYILNDLIRILLIRELTGRPGGYPPIKPVLPPRPGNPQRPPFFRPYNLTPYSF